MICLPKLRLASSREEGEFESGTNLFEALREMGEIVKGFCGGKGLCGKCRILITEGEAQLSEVTDPERKFLSEDQLEAGYRLACQAQMMGNSVAVRVPDYSARSGEMILEDGMEVEYEVDPPLKKLHLDLAEPSLDDPTPDYERLVDGIEREYGIHVDKIDYELQKKLPTLLRSGADSGGSLEVTATVFDEEEIIDVEAGWKDDLYGLAVDVGTTTLVAYLVDLNTGETLSTSSVLNPQVEMGGDLVTRITEVTQGSVSKSEAQDLILEGVNGLIDDNLAQSGVERDAIYYAAFVGNTAMHHFTLGIDPKYVARSPFVPARKGQVRIKAGESGLALNQSGYVTWLPLNGGWVGADNVGTLLAAEIGKREEMTLVIDIGTNGEVALGNRKGALVTSTAAGPALEGYSIKHGMRGKQGSIERLTIEENSLEPDFQTVGDIKPIGLCGSGIIDAAAELLRTGIIGRSGRFRSPGSTERVREGEDGQPEYVIAWREETGLETEITFTQGDIREVQKAKGAIQAATRVLMDEVGTEKVDRVLLAGAFGNYISSKSALIIGLFPECDLEKVTSIGNSAGVGAKLVLLDREKMEEAKEIADFVEFYEIAGREGFRENYMASLGLPHEEPGLYPQVRELLDGSSDRAL